MGPWLVAASADDRVMNVVHLCILRSDGYKNKDLHRWHDLDDIWIYTYIIYIYIYVYIIHLIYHVYIYICIIQIDICLPT